MTLSVSTSLRISSLALRSASHHQHFAPHLIISSSFRQEPSSSAPVYSRCQALPRETCCPIASNYHQSLDIFKAGLKGFLLPSLSIKSNSCKAPSPGSPHVLRRYINCLHYFIIIIYSIERNGNRTQTESGKLTGVFCHCSVIRTLSI